MGSVKMRPSSTRALAQALRLLQVLFVVLAILPLGAVPGADAAEQAAPLPAIPSSFFTVVDQGGANDYTQAQGDLTQMGRDDSSADWYKLFWSWDATGAWTGGGNTGDACALFDSDGDGNINYAVCGQITNLNADPTIVSQTSTSPYVWSCGDGKADRCTTPTAVTYAAGQVLTGGLFNFTRDANLITNTDPFPNLKPDQNWPNDSTLQIHILKSLLPTGAVLTNVCSFASVASGVNNNPSDCILAPASGFLVIQKVAGANTTTPFNFTVSPVPTGVPSGYTITGSGTTGQIVLAVGTSTETVTETVPQNWSLTAAGCTLSSGAATGTRNGNAVSGITIQSGEVTTCTFTNTAATPGLTLVKTATPATYGTVGQGISYSYLLRNTGNVTLSGPFTVTDDKATVTCPATPTTLAPNDSITCTATYTITQADLDAGSVTNTAQGHALYGTTPVTSSPDSETVTAIQNPLLVLTKSAAEATYDSVGDLLHYTLVATNVGGVTLTNVTIADPLLPALVCTPNQPATLAPGASLTCSGTHTTTQADLDAGRVDNTATADSDQSLSVSASKSVTATQSPALTLVKSADPASYNAVGQVIAYSYLVANSGNVTLSNIAVVDDKVTVACPDTSEGLAPLATITCTATYTITQADIEAGAVTNTAYARSGATQSPPDSETVNATQSPHISITKTAKPNFGDPVKVGDTISYTIVATNDGNVQLTRVSIEDPKLDTLTGATCVFPASLAPGEKVTCYGTYTLTQADVDAGKVDNTASVRSLQGDPPMLAQASAHVAVPQSPKLTLVKTASPTTYAKVGDVIAYSYKVTNTGNVTLAGPFTVIDDKVTVTCPATASLAPGASITCSATYAITRADVDAGKVTNTAYAVAGTTRSNADSETVTKRPSVLPKTGGPSAMPGAAVVALALILVGLYLRLRGQALPVPADEVTPDGQTDRPDRRV